MKSIRILAFALVAAFAGTVLLTHVRADEWDKTTKVTFGEAVQIPGTVLPPGNYTLVLANIDSNRHVVQVFNDTRTQLIATVMAIPNYQLQPAGKTILEFAERPTGQPVALEAWFYPGDNFGQEFVYPKAQAAQLSQLNGTTVPSTDDTQSTPAPEPAAAPGPNANSAMTQPAAEAPLTAQDMNTTPAPVTQEPPVTPSDTPQTQNQPQATDKELPKTASDLPLAAVAGFLALGGALVLHRVTRRQS